MSTNVKSRVGVSLFLVAISLFAGGCSKTPPVPDPAQVPVDLQVDSIQKDPTLTAQQKQEKIQALQNKR